MSNQEVADYGGKGCRCWRSEDYNPWDDRTHDTWYPNASCPHHGLLAGLARDRMETGTYRVVGPPALPELAHKDAEAESWAEVLRGDDEPVHCPSTTEEETGVQSAVRRWWRGLDPIRRDWHAYWRGRL